MATNRPEKTTTAVVTGAASGIGRSLAIALARRGHRLHMTDRNPDGLAETRATIENEGRGEVVSSHVINITVLEDVVKWANRIMDEDGVPDEVYHVAGIAIWGDPVTMPHEKWKAVIDVNLMGFIHVVEAFVPRLVTGSNDNEHGKVGRASRRKLVAVSSAAGIIGLPWHAAYSASKGGVNGLCEVLRFDLAPRGVDVHVVAPGAVDTPLVSTIDIHGVDQSQPRVARAKGLFQRMAKSPDQAAAAIIQGVSKHKYLIFTSKDIAFARWAQVNIPWLYTAIMRGLNKGLRWAAQGSE